MKCSATSAALTLSLSSPWYVSKALCAVDYDCFVKTCQAAEGAERSNKRLPKPPSMRLRKLLLSGLREGHPHNDGSASLRECRKVAWRSQVCKRILAWRPLSAAATFFSMTNRKKWRYSGAPTSYDLKTSEFHRGFSRSHLFSITALWRWGDASRTRNPTFFVRIVPSAGSSAW